MSTRDAALVSALFGAVALLCASARAQAHITSVATVEVCPPLSVGILETPSWGRVVRPDSGTAQYKLDYRTSAVTVLGGRGRALGDGRFGEYSVSGIPASPVSYVVTVGSFSGEGVRVVASHVNGVSDSGIASLGWDGNLLLKIGGILEVDSTATNSPQDAILTVSVDYQ